MHIKTVVLRREYLCDLCLVCIDFSVKKAGYKIQIMFLTVNHLSDLGETAYM